LYEGDNHTFEYYEDDGETFEYKNGKYFKRKIQHFSEEKKLVFEKVEGSYTSHFNTIRLFFHGFSNYKNSVKLNGTDLKITLEHISFVEPLSDFDPYHKPPKDRVVIMDVNTVEFNNSTKKFEITWG
ncbi:MAG: DUF5110 domain-containing protein, partial [Bacteroidota bacterium]|jgi:alpha-glucosidase